jgi:hypothetical protein
MEWRDLLRIMHATLDISPRCMTVILSRTVYVMKWNKTVQSKDLQELLCLLFGDRICLNYANS